MPIISTARCPITRELTADEIKNDYVRATGVAITEAFGNRDPMEVPAALVAGHGPFAWGKTPDDAVHNAVVLEAVARMAMYTFSLQPERARACRRPFSTGTISASMAQTATYGQAEK